MTSSPTTAPPFRHTIIPGAGNRLRVVITMDPPVHPIHPIRPARPARPARRPRPGPGPRTQTRRPRPGPFPRPVESAPLSLLAAPTVPAQPRSREHARQVRRRWLVVSVLLVLGVGVGVPLLFQALYAFLGR